MLEAELLALLENRRDDLESVSGVSAVGIGSARGEGASDRAIHVYLEPQAAEEHVHREIRSRIPGVPFETIRMDMPEAQAKPKEEN